MDRNSASLIACLMRRCFKCRGSLSHPLFDLGIRAQEIAPDYGCDLLVCRYMNIPGNDHLLFKNLHRLICCISLSLQPTVSHKFGHPYRLCLGRLATHHREPRLLRLASLP